MNNWLLPYSGQRFIGSARTMLNHGTRISRNVLCIVGGCAVCLAVVLWLSPSMRTPLAAKLMPFISAAVQAGPVRLLNGDPLPALNVTARTDEISGAVTAADNVVGYDGAFDGSGHSGFAAINLAQRVHSSQPSLGMLAALIPSQRVAADARNSLMVFTSANEQNLITNYLSRRYRVAREPINKLVSAAFDTGGEVGLDPLLLLAVMAIESGFNPYAESGVGAQGLMQVMSKVHSDKFQYFGGASAALEPTTNIKVGALVLKDCLARGGSLAGGLRLYVGATSRYDGGYGAKVIAERDRLRAIAYGHKVSIHEPQRPVQVAAQSGSVKRARVSLDSHDNREETKTLAPVASSSDQQT